MGTIDKIIDGLNSSKADKITRLNKRFDENKIWMTKEFDQIRSLIEPIRAKGVAKKPSADKNAKAPSSSSSVGTGSSTSSSRHAVTAAAPGLNLLEPLFELVRANLSERKRRKTNAKVLKRLSIRKSAHLSTSATLATLRRLFLLLAFLQT